MTKPSSEAILDRLARGEPGAAEACLDQYGDLVWSLARRHSVHQDDAEDAVQDIFLDLWKSAGRFDAQRGSEVTFICTVARRRLIDRRRYIQRRPQADSLQNDEGEMKDLPDNHDAHIEARAEASLALRALKTLDVKEREVIRLSVVLGMSHSEIAKHTQLPLGTVKTYIRRGLIRVHDAIEQRVTASTQGATP